MATSTPEQQKLFLDLQSFDDATEFQKVYQNAQANIRELLAEVGVQGPYNPVAVTIAELSGLYALLCEKLPAGPGHALLRDGVRMLSTAQDQFRGALQNGEYRPMTVSGIIEASRPLRAKMRLLGKVVFIHRPSIAEDFADANSSGTLEEEQRDLEAISSLLKAHEEALKDNKHFSPAIAEEVKSLLGKIKERHFLSVLGLKNGREAIELRDRLLTYAVLVGKRCAADGALEFFNEEETRSRFEEISLSRAIRARQANKKTRETEEAPLVQAE